LASVTATEYFESRIRALNQHIQTLLLEDATGSQLILFNRAVSDFSNYNVMHSLLCAALVHMLARIFKLYPPGTYVQLANGETAVVICRGIKPAEPFVASVFNRDKQLIVLPRRISTTSKETAITSSLVASEVKFNVKIAQLLRLIPS